MTLAGCAANQTTKQADASSSSITRQLRSSYLSQTQSDPLGAYLAKRDRDDKYPVSHAQGAKGTMVAAAMSVLGTKYQFGGDEPDTGFDCSGLVVYAAERSLGLKLPRRAREIAQTGTSVGLKDLKRGDLVFFNTRGSRFSHVGIYVGNSKFVHAPRSGAVVRVEDMDGSYWKKRFNGARRLAAAPGATASR